MSSIANLREVLIQDQDQSIFTILVVGYMDLVDFIARAYHKGLPSYVSIEDLKSAGYIGLMDAIHKYDPYSENKFETYAKFRILGAMQDDSRKRSYLTRTQRQKRRESGENKSEVSYYDEELFDKLLTPSHYCPPSPLISALKSEINKILAEMIELLPELGQKVIVDSYLNEIVLAEIAKKLHLSEGRICQIRSECLKKLSDMILERYQKSEILS